MDAQNPTGSQKMLTALIQKGSAATADDVRAALALPVAADYKLLRWLIRGIPAVYLEVESVFQVQASRLSDAVTHLVATEGIRHINILVNGIPKPDLAEITSIVAHGDAKAIG